MSFFTQSGDMFSPTAGRDALLETLPVGNYIVVETMQGLMFKRVDAFPEPGRMYGKINEHADRIFNTFESRPRTTGVLLSGEKGSGKSQLARNVSRLGYAHGYPTILVNAPFYGDAFNALLATIEQPAIILMDEFEKVYAQQEMQEQVLTLLDGMMTSKKLFILTVNDRYKVNYHMKNRPGRLFYQIEFDGLQNDFVREYCDDNLDNGDEADGVLKVASMFQAFNFDMLKALVEEMNRYKENAFDALELLNAKPFEITASESYEVTATKDGYSSQVVTTHEMPMTTRQGAVHVYFTFDKPAEKENRRTMMKALTLDDDYQRGFLIQSKQVRKIDADTGAYEFLVDGWVISYKRKKRETYGDYRQYAY